MVVLIHIAKVDSQNAKSGHIVQFAHFCIAATFWQIAVVPLRQNEEAMSKTIIENMLGIVKKMKGDNKGCLSLRKMKDASEDIDALKERLGMTQKEVILLTAIMQMYSQRHISGREIANYLGIEFLEYLSFSDEIENLREKEYILVESDGDIYVPKWSLNQIKQDRPVFPEPTTGLDTAAILSRIKKILKIRKESMYTTRETVEKCSVLLERNTETSISKACLKILNELDSVEKMALFGLIYRYYYEDDDQVGWHDFDEYYTDDELDGIKNRYILMRMVLQRKEFIEYAGDDAMLTKEYFHIKDDIKEKIFSDVGGFRKKKPTVSASRMVEATTIAVKDLFYNPAEARQVAQLGDLLSEGRFAGIRSAMKEKHLRTGFTCLFYGSPGTGKTETAYQLARITGRDIFIVDVSQIKSCWVGESEQNLKEVFNKYRECVNRNDATPILLFNEADAILGIRQEGAQRAVDKMENSLQNIILQEMEDLDGILIATTNLTANLDKAFERRFLYKIRFEKPSLEASSHIWQSMIPELSDTEAIQLATDYPFSGGQIENISRKKTIFSLISGNEPAFSDIRAYCEEEMITRTSTGRRIGF